MRGCSRKAIENIAVRRRGCKAKGNVVQRLFRSKELKHGKQATINRF
jgi:hypothetical protein